jgi:hypothetical protein
MAQRLPKSANEIDHFLVRKAAKGGGSIDYGRTRRTRYGNDWERANIHRSELATNRTGPIDSALAISSNGSPTKTSSVGAFQPDLTTRLRLPSQATFAFIIKRPAMVEGALEPNSRRTNSTDFPRISASCFHIVLPATAD